MISKNATEFAKTGLEIQKARFDVASKRKGKNEHFAKAIDKWGADIDHVVKLNQRHGHKEKSGESFMKGFANGLSGGLRRQDEESFEKTFDYFNQNVEAIEAQNRAGAAKQEKIDKVAPYATAGLEMMHSDLPHETVMPQLKKMWEQAQMHNPDLNGSIVGYIPNSSFVNVRDDAGNVQAVSLATFVDQDQYQKMIKQNLLKQKLNNDLDPNTIANKNKQAYIDQTKNHFDPELQGKIASEKEKGKLNAKIIHDIDTKVHAMDRLYADNNEIIKIISNSKLAGTGTLKAMQTYLAEKTGRTHDIDAIKMLVASQYSKADEILGKGVRSDSDMKMFAKTIPSLDKNPQAVLKLLEAQQTQIEKERKAGRIKLKKFADNPLANLTDDTDYSEGMYGASPTQQAEMSRIPISPENPLPLTPEEQQAAGQSPMVPQQPEVPNASAENPPPPPTANEQTSKLMKFSDGTTKVIPAADVERMKQWGQVVDE